MTAITATERTVRFEAVCSAERAEATIFEQAARAAGYDPDDGETLADAVNAALADPAYQAARAATYAAWAAYGRSLPRRRQHPGCGGAGD